MERNFKWRLLLILVVAVASVLYVIPSVTPTLPAFWKKVLPSDRVRLGLDLRGGMHLVLEVQAQKAVESALERNADELKYGLRKAGIPATDLAKTEANTIELVLPKAQDLDRLNDLLNKEFGELATKSTTSETEGRMKIVLEYKEAAAKQVREMAVRQALETIRNRIDQFGVTEPDIRPQGEDRIVVQLPGVKDTDRAIRLIGQTARLEFKLVDEEHSVEKALTDGPPPGTEIVEEVETDPQSGRTKKTPFLIQKQLMMTGEYITDARVSIDNQYNTPYVSLSFDAKGARLFERITADNVKRRLAIILDGVVKSAPVIQEKISGGKASITGTFTQDQARDLAIVLRAGALAAPVTVLEERTVGPSLGQDSINQGMMSVILAGVLIVLFMAVYYRVSGLIADLVLVLNILIMMAALAAFKATLTLPGIAGIILTLGMAVDANVLIFERIREETRLGKTPRAAVDTGFSKASWTIFDANLTTLFAAIVLYQFGTGPIRGFAVTLSIGIVASMFTAIFVARLIFDYLLVRFKLSKISI